MYTSLLLDLYKTWIFTILPHEPSPSTLFWTNNMKQICFSTYFTKPVWRGVECVLPFYDHWMNPIIWLIRLVYPCTAHFDCLLYHYCLSFDILEWENLRIQTIVTFKEIELWNLLLVFNMYMRDTFCHGYALVFETFITLNVN